MDAAFRQLIDAEVEIKAYAVALSSIENSMQRDALSVRSTYLSAHMQWELNVSFIPATRYPDVLDRCPPHSNMSGS